MRRRPRSPSSPLRRACRLSHPIPQRSCSRTAQRTLRRPPARSRRRCRAPRGPRPLRTARRRRGKNAARRRTAPARRAARFFQAQHENGSLLRTRRSNSRRAKSPRRSRSTASRSRRDRRSRSRFLSFRIEGARRAPPKYRSREIISYHILVKFRNSFKPASPLFSGWNCTPYALPAHTAETNGR